MVPIFLAEAKINNLRHLRNVDICISSNEKKHLIITGRNGSGKSTILNEIKNHILARTMNWLPDQTETANAANNFYNHAHNALQSLRNTSSYNNQEGIVSESVYEVGNIYADGYQKQMQLGMQMSEFLNDYGFNYPKRSEMIFINNEYIYSEFNSTRFITSYYDAKRSTFVNNPAGIVPLNYRSSYSINTNIGKSFLQYMVNLRAEQSFANDENDMYTKDKIKGWFDNFELQLRFIFDNESLKLVFDRKYFKFYIDVDNRNRFDFNSMSEGFSSVLSIVTDLLLKTENVSFNDYSGVVLIDEVETHLHIDLQKKIMPFLTNLFPTIQFIVTTHSPFVLNSLSNTVIYDAEKNTRFEDFSSFSSEGIIEGYFRQDKYSEVIKRKIDRFEDLYGNKDLGDDEKQELSFLQKYFEEIPKFYSKELALKIEQIKLAAIA